MQEISDKMHRGMSRLGLLLTTGLLLLFMLYRWQPGSNQATCSDDLDLQQEEIDRLQNGFSKVDDPCLISHIRHAWLHAPSGGPYKPADLGLRDASQYGQSKAALTFLNGRRGGFFIECGAANGVVISNTILLERTAQWTGLLIEANPAYFPEILQHNRKTHAINACLSTSNQTGRLQFDGAGLFGGLVSNLGEKHKKLIGSAHSKKITTQCFPLYSILLALGKLRIDYFSLDVEGPELEIVQTIPLREVFIDLFSIEYRCLNADMSIDEEATIAKLTRIRDYFDSTGIYEEVGIVPWGTHDNKERKASRGIDVFFRRIQV